MIFWELNGSRVLGFEDLPQGVNIGIDSLIIGGRLELNATTIQCIAESTGVSVETSIVTILIQGQLMC